jgi:hypothetical protein
MFEDKSELLNEREFETPKGVMRARYRGNNHWTIYLGTQTPAQGLTIACAKRATCEMIYYAYMEHHEK